MGIGNVCNFSMRNHAEHSAKNSDVTYQHILQLVHLRHALLLVNFMIKLQS